MNTSRSGGALRAILFFIIFKIVTTATNKCNTNANFQSSISDVRKEHCLQAAQATCGKYKHSAIRVAYYDMPPFTSSRTDGRHRILQDVVEVALSECCGLCSDARYRIHGNHDDMMMGKEFNESVVQFPVLTQGKHRSDAVIPLIRLSAAVYIIRSAVEATTFGKAVFWAVFDIWPLLGISLLLAYASGLIMYMTDTWKNKEHFPRQFLKGSFEGFWWSFVSMTTVGYGDVRPKSYLAKLFAVFWILCGITIMSLVTAAITTAIANVIKAMRPSIQHGSVGILDNHLFEKSILMKGNAKVISKPHITDLIDALHKGAIDGILLDSYTLKLLHGDLLIQKKLFIGQVIEDTDDSYLGVGVEDEQLFDLINWYINFQSDIVRDYVHLNTKFSINELVQKNIPANIIFTTESGIYYFVLVIGAVIIITAIITGISYELYQEKKVLRRIEQRKRFVLTPKSLRKEEERLEMELRDMLHRWDQEILCIVDTYSIHGLLTNSNKNDPVIIVRLRTKKCSGDFSGDEENQRQELGQGQEQDQEQEHEQEQEQPQRQQIQRNGSTNASRTELRPGSSRQRSKKEKKSLPPEGELEGTAKQTLKFSKGKMNWVRAVNNINTQLSQDLHEETEEESEEG